MELSPLRSSPRLHESLVRGTVREMNAMSRLPGGLRARFGPQSVASGCVQDGEQVGAHANCEHPRPGGDRRKERDEGPCHPGELQARFEACKRPTACSLGCVSLDDLVK